MTSVPGHSLCTFRDTDTTSLTLLALRRSAHDDPSRLRSQQARSAQTAIGRAFVPVLKSGTIKRRLYFKINCQRTAPLHQVVHNRLPAATARAKAIEPMSPTSLAASHATLPPLRSIRGRQSCQQGSRLTAFYKRIKPLC